MPKSSDVLAIVLAALAHFLVGFILYGVVFGEAWLRHTLVLYGDMDMVHAAGMSRDQLQDEWGRAFPDTSRFLPMVFGFLANVVVACALWLVLPRLGVRGVLAYSMYAGLLSLGFVFPGLLTGHVYSPVPDPRAFIDVLHVVLGFLLAGAVLGYARSWSDSGKGRQKEE